MNNAQPTGANQLDMISQNLNANRRNPNNQTQPLPINSQQNNFLSPNNHHHLQNASFRSNRPNSVNQNSVRNSGRNNIIPAARNQTYQSNFSNQINARSRSQNITNLNQYSTRSRGNSRNPLQNNISQKNVIQNDNRQNHGPIRSHSRNRSRNNANYNMHTNNYNGSNNNNINIVRASPLQQRVPTQYTTELDHGGSEDAYEMEMYTSAIRQSNVNIQDSYPRSRSRGSRGLSANSTGRLKGSGFLHIPKVQQPVTKFQQADKRRKNKGPKQRKRYLRNDESLSNSRNSESSGVMYENNIKNQSNNPKDNSEFNKYNPRKASGFNQDYNGEAPIQRLHDPNADWTMITDESDRVIEGYNRGEVDLKEKQLRDYEKTRSELKNRRDQLFTRKYNLSEKDRINDIFSEHTTIATFAGQGRNTNPPVSRLQQLDVFAESFPRSKNQQKISARQVTPRRTRGNNRGRTETAKSNGIKGLSKGIDPFSYTVDLTNLRNSETQGSQSSISKQSDQFSYKKNKRLYKHKKSNKKFEPQNSEVFDPKIEKKLRGISKSRVQNEMLQAHSHGTEARLKNEIMTLNTQLTELDFQYQNLKKDQSNPIVVEEQIKKAKSQLDQINQEITKIKNERLTAGDEIRNYLEIDSDMKGIMNLLTEDEKILRDKLLAEVLKADRTHLRLKRENQDFRSMVEHGDDYDSQKDLMLQDELQKIQFELASERRDGEEEELLRLMNRMYAQFNSQNR